jgi:hypothetical protein
MSLHGPSRVGKHIAPASDLIIDEDNKLRISFVDIFKNKMPHLLKWQASKTKEIVAPALRHLAFRGNMRCDLRQSA